MADERKCFYCEKTTQVAMYKRIMGESDFMICQVCHDDLPTARRRYLSKQYGRDVADKLTPQAAASLCKIM